MDDVVGVGLLVGGIRIKVAEPTVGGRLDDRVKKGTLRASRDCLG